MSEEPVLADQIGRRSVTERDVKFSGAIWDVLSDKVDFAPGVEFTRDYIRHTGAVSVCAVRERDGVEEVLLIFQYRHPAGVTFWEFPAGLLDFEGESPDEAAHRELREETAHDVSELKVLVDLFPSAGGSDEAIRVFLARDPFPAVAEGFVKEAEETELIQRWWPIESVMQQILAGKIQNGVVCAAIPAYLAAKAAGQLDTLRAADSPWPAAPRVRGL